MERKASRLTGAMAAADRLCLRPAAHGEPEFAGPEYYPWKMRIQVRSGYGVIIRKLAAGFGIGFLHATAGWIVSREEPELAVIYPGSTPAPP